MRTGKRLRTVYRWSDENCSAADGVRAIASTGARVCVCECASAKRTASTGIQCRCACRVGRAVGPAASRRRQSGRVRGRPAIGRPGVPERSAAAMGTARAVPHRRPRNTHLGFFREEGKKKYGTRARIIYPFTRSYRAARFYKSRFFSFPAHWCDGLSPPHHHSVERRRAVFVLPLLLPLFVLSSRFPYRRRGLASRAVRTRVCDLCTYLY